MGEDDRLKLALAVGDAASYRQAYDLYGPVLLRAAARMLGNPADAEDAVQEVFTALVRSRSRIAQVVDLKAYLFASIRNAASRIGRSRKNQPTVAMDETATPSPTGPDAEDAEWLWRMAAQLPDAQRDVPAMKIQGELTFEQIGRVFGISPNTAASRYRYALEKLHQMLARQRQ